MTDTQHTLSESKDKIRVETQVKRGSSTRDEDRIKVKVKGDDAAQVVQKLNDTIELLQETGDTLRQLQPEADDV